MVVKNPVQARRCGTRIPTAKHSKVSAVIVVHYKHVLFSQQREVLLCTTCIVSLDKFLVQVYGVLLSLYPFVRFPNFFSYNQGVKIVRVMGI